MNAAWEKKDIPRNTRRATGAPWRYKIEVGSTEPCFPLRFSVPFAVTSFFFQRYALERHQQDSE